MPENLSALYKYLKQNDIVIDKNEFEFQMKSHPDYPSLLSISDTLDFLNIENFVARIGFDDLKNLPDNFVAVLKIRNMDQQLYNIEHVNESFFCSNEKNRFAFNSLELKDCWTGIILLAKSIKELEIKTARKKNLWPSLGFLAFILFLFLIWNTKNPDSQEFFLLFPIAGLLLSVAALKDILGTKNELLNKFCKITATTDCTSVIASSKWNLFKTINFSDLSFVFFAAQLLGLTFFLLAGNATVYFSVFNILLWCTIPIIGVSIYYQKYVEKKWCPICLAIISIIILEMVYCSVLITHDLSVSVKDAAVILLIFTVVILSWGTLKRILDERNELKESQIESRRITRNYSIFKNSLLASEKTNYDFITASGFLLGNKDAVLKITVVTNPYCSHCSSAHFYIEEILKRHKDSICIDIRFNFKIDLKENNSSDIYLVHQKLAQIYLQKGEDQFTKSLHEWFSTKDKEKLAAVSDSASDNYRINEMLDQQHFLNYSNKISFTPAILINNCHFPKAYDRKDLIYFINDLLEDDEICSIEFPEAEYFK